MYHIVIFAETVLDRVVSGLTDIADKMLKAPDENAEIANALKADKGNYHAVSIPVDYSLAAESLVPLSHVEDSMKHKLNKLTVSVRKDMQKKNNKEEWHIREFIFLHNFMVFVGHVPGKAGGGWESHDDDDDNTIMNNDLEFANASSNVLRSDSPQRSIEFIQRSEVCMAYKLNLLILKGVKGMTQI